MIAEKNCATCAKYLRFARACEEKAGAFEPGSSCESWAGDCSLVCQICGGKADASDAEKGLVQCSENQNHMACVWDGEWYDSEALGK